MRRRIVNNGDHQMMLIDHRGRTHRVLPGHFADVQSVNGSSKFCVLRVGRRRDRFVSAAGQDGKPPQGSNHG